MFQPHVHFWRAKSIGITRGEKYWMHQVDVLPPHSRGRAPPHCPPPSILKLQLHNPPPPRARNTSLPSTTPALSMPTTLSPLQGCLSRYGMQTDVPNPLGRPFKLLQLQSHSREGFFWLLSIFSYCLLHKSFEGLPLIDQHSFCNCFWCGESFAKIKYHFSDWRFRPTQFDSREKRCTTVRYAIYCFHERLM